MVQFPVLRSFWAVLMIFPGSMADPDSPRPKNFQDCPAPPRPTLKIFLLQERAAPCIPGWKLKSHNLIQRFSEFFIRSGLKLDPDLTLLHIKISSKADLLYPKTFLTISSKTLNVGDASCNIYVFNASTHDKKALYQNYISFSTVIQNEDILAVRGVFTAAHSDKIRRRIIVQH